MRYLVGVDACFLDAPGGSQRIAWELACAMRDRGHQVAMISGSRPQDPPPGVVETEGITICRYRYPRLSKLDPRRFYAHGQAARQAFAALPSRTWDVVHGHSIASAYGLFKLPSFRRRIYTVHSPVVLEQRINWSDGSFAGWLKRHTAMWLLSRAERFLLCKADVATALSEYTVRELVAQHGTATAERVRVIPGWSSVAPSPASRSEARSQLNWPSDARVIFSMRRLVSRMGLDTLIDAIPLLRERSKAVLYIAGEGPERQALESRAAERHISDRVHFMGRCSDEQAALAYRAADVFVVPSRSLECFGLIVVEALASGCPVVSSRAGALPEVLEPLNPNWLFESGDSAALASTIDGVLSTHSSLDAAAYVACRFGKQDGVTAFEKAVLATLDQ